MTLTFYDVRSALVINYRPCVKNKHTWYVSLSMLSLHMYLALELQRRCSIFVESWVFRADFYLLFQTCLVYVGGMNWRKYNQYIWGRLWFQNLNFLHLTNWRPYTIDNEPAKCVKAQHLLHLTLYGTSQAIILSFNLIRAGQHTGVICSLWSVQN